MEEEVGEAGEGSENRIAIDRSTTAGWGIRGAGTRRRGRDRGRGRGQGQGSGTIDVGPTTVPGAQDLLPTRARVLALAQETTSFARNRLLEPHPSNPLDDLAPPPARPPPAAPTVDTKARSPPVSLRLFSEPLATNRHLATGRRSHFRSLAPLGGRTRAPKSSTIRTNARVQQKREGRTRSSRRRSKPRTHQLWSPTSSSTTSSTSRLPLLSTPLPCPAIAPPSSAPNSSPASWPNTAPRSPTKPSLLPRLAPTSARS